MWKAESELGGRKQFSLEVRIADAREYFERIFEVHKRWSNNIGRPCNQVVSMVHGIDHPFIADVPVSAHALFGSSYIHMVPVV